MFDERDGGMMTAINWKTGSTDVWSDSAAWSTGTVPGATDDVTISVAPATANVPYTVEIESAVSVHSITMSQTAATLLVTNTTLSVGTTFALNAGAIDLEGGGTLQGGTYTSTTGSVLLGSHQASSINNVTWDGTLNLDVSATGSAGSSSVYINSLTMHGVGGTGVGTMAIAAGVSIYLTSGVASTLSNAAITLANGSALYDDGTLTIASSASVVASGIATMGGGTYSGYVLTNQGKISVAGTASTLSISTGSFTNTGTVQVSAGGTVLIDSTTGSNSGLLYVGTGSLLELETTGASGFTNTGSLSIGGTLALDYGLTTAQLAAISAPNGTIAVAGTLTNTGKTLATGSKLAGLELFGGTINGGTIVNSGHFGFASSGGSYSTSVGTLNAVTFDGAINLTTNQYLTIQGSLTLAGSAGTGAGTLAVTGTGAAIDFTTTQVLNNAIIKLGSASTTFYSASAASLAAGAYNESVATTLVLGSTTTLTQASTYASLSILTANDAIINQGTITAAISGGTLALGSLTNAATLNDSNEVLLVTGYISGGTLANSGTLSLSGSLAAINPYDSGSMLTNSGLLSVSSGASVALGSNLGFTNTGTLSIANALATLYGTYTTASLGTIKATTGGTLGIAGTLTNSATLSLGSSGTIATLALDSGASLIGGTIKDSGGGLLASNGTLSGVTYDGTLGLATGGKILTVTGGLTMAGYAGTGAGSISVTGSSTQLIFLGSQTLNNVNVSIGDAGSASYFTYASIVAGTYNESAAATLTLGPTAHVTQGGAYAALSSYNSGTDTIINHGTITAAYLAGEFSAGGLVNDGTILVSNGDDLYGVAQNAGTIGVSGGILALGGTLQNTGALSIAGTSSAIYESSGCTLANSGTLAVSNGASLALGNQFAFSNPGTLLVSAANVSLYGSYTTATFGTVEVTSGGTLSLDGTLTNTGTLAVGTGSNIPTLGLGYGGTIIGGTIVDAGGGIPATGGTLSGVTYKGALTLAAANASLTIAGGLTLQPATGSVAGTLAVTGGGAVLNLLGSQTLTNAQINLAGNPNSNNGYPAIQLSDRSGSGASTVTLAAGSTLLQSGSGYLEGTDAYNTVTENDGPTGDTLINDGTVSFAESGGYCYVEYLTLQNAGTLSVANGEYLAIDDGTLTNSGTMSLSGSYSALGFDTADGNNDGFTNTGLVTIGATDTLTLDGTANYVGAGALNWSNAGTINVAGGVFTAGGAFTIAQLGTVVTSNGGTVEFAGDAYLDNTGGTLTVGTGTALGTIVEGGTIHGGIILDEGGGLNFLGAYNYQTGVTTYGTLDAVTYRGSLTLAANETATITGGITLQALSGSGAGTILLNNTGSTLDFASTETLNGAYLYVGAALGGNAFSAATPSGATTLTLGTNLKLTQTGAAFTLGGYDGTIRNTANLGFAQAGGTLTLAGTLVNSGTLAVSNGETLVLATTSLQNTGVISVTNGLLAVGNATSAQLAEITLVNSDLAITGTLTATGATLTVGTGTSIPVIKLDGTISGGIIHDAGNGVQFLGYSTLQNVTYQGTLYINRPLSVLSVTGSFAATGPSGSGAGSLVLTGAGSALDWNTTQALNNATVSIGNAGLTYEGHTVSAPAIAAGYGDVLTLGAQLSVQQSGTYADIGGSYAYGYLDTGGGIIQSAATITAAVSGGDFTLGGQTFTSTGTIAISNTDTITAAAAGTTNAGLITIATGSALNLDLYNYFADSSLADESFINTGTITLSGGTINELTDGGTFPAVNMLNAAGAHIKGYGTLAAPILNNGVIEAAGGTLALSQAVSGAGTLQVDAGAVLNLAAVSSGETAAFSGTGGVLGLSPPSFLGVIGGFATGDTIDLAGIAAKSATFSGASIVVTLTAGGTLTLATTSALTGTLTVTAGNHSDSLIKFSTAAVKTGGGSLHPLPIAGPVAADFAAQPIVATNETASVQAGALGMGVPDTSANWVPILHS